MADGSQKYRSFYARLICAAAKLDDPRVEEAFRYVEREPFAGPGPWWLNLGGGQPYVQTPDDDPSFLYQDLLLALDRERELNIGMPSAHAYWLGACKIREAETVIRSGRAAATIRRSLRDWSARVAAFTVMRSTRDSRHALARI
jgi:protein-L-isoaspartate(D-aspartate) O-methyltransferase